MASGENVSYMLSVVPGTMTGFATLNAGLSSINNAFLQLTGAIDNSVGLWNSMMITAGVVATQFATDAMNAFGQFEQSMKIVQMVSGQTADQISYLSQKANEFSVQYRMDIDQITEGLQTLGRAGLNTASEQAEVLQNGLNTAKLEGRELNSVLQELIQNTALLGGDLKSDQFGEQSQYVNDLLVATSMTAPITTHDISETLKYSGGIAAAAGANIESEQGKKILEDYMGAIAAFAQKGVSGSIAGTALRAFFNKPATQDSSVVDALSSIGLKAEDLWERGGDTMRPVSEQIGIIKGKMEELNISTMDQLQIWSKIVGGKMGQQMMKLDSENIKEITKDIQAADNAQSLATRSMQTYQANVKQIGEAGQLAFRNFGMVLVKIINPFLELVKPIVEFLSNDFMALPLAAGFIRFMAYVISKIRQVGAALRQEISAFRNLYRSGRSTTFAQWRENVTGGRRGSGSTKGGSASKTSSKSTTKSSKEATKEPKSLSALAKSLKKQVTQSVWEEYKQGKLTADQAVALHKTASWTGKYSHGISDAQIMNELIRTNALPKEMLHDLTRHGMTKKAWMGKWGVNSQYDEYSALAEQTTVLQDAVKRATQAEQEASKSKEQSITITKEQIRAAEAHSRAIGFAEEEIVNETTSTTSKVILEWNTMCANLVQGIRRIQWATYEPLYSSPIGPRMSSNLTPVMPGSISPQAMQNAKDMEVLRKAEEEKLRKAHLVQQARQEYADKEAKALANAKNEQEIGAIRKERQELENKYGKAYDYQVKKAAVQAKYSPKEESFVQPKRTSYMGDNIFYKLNDKDKRYEPVARPLPHNAPKDPGLSSFTNSYRSFYEEEKKRLQVKQQLMENERTLSEQKVQDDVKNYTRTSEEQANKRRLVQQARQEYADKDAKARQALDEHQTRVRINELKKQNNRLVQQQQKNTAREAEAMRALDRYRENEGRHQTEKYRAIRESDKPVSSSLVTKPYQGKSVSEQAELRNKERLDKETSKASQARLKTERAIQNVAKKSELNVERMKRLSTERLSTEEKINRLSASRSAEEQKTSSLWTSNQKRSIASINQAALQGKNTMSDYTRGRGGMLIYSPSSSQGSTTKKKGESTSQHFIRSLKERLTADRSDKLINFKGTGKVAKTMNGLANAAGGVTSMMGGPLMIAMMALTFVIQTIEGEMEKYNQRVQEADQRLSDAYSALESAEDKLRSTFAEGNPGSSAEEIDQMILDTYSEMHKTMVEASEGAMDKWVKASASASQKIKDYEYNSEKDDGSMKELAESQKSYAEKVDENTAALYAATSELSQAMSKYVQTSSDVTWGVDGLSTTITDNTAFSLTHMNPFETNSYEDSNEFILTASQQDEKYAGNKEMVGLFLEDFKDSKKLINNSVYTQLRNSEEASKLTQKEYQTIVGLTTLMGGLDSTMELWRVLGEDARKFLVSTNQFASSISAADNMRLQQSMQRDKTTWQSLAKEVAKQENKNRKTLDKKSSNKKIEGLIAKLQATMGSGFSDTQILQAAYLQMMQDMYSIAQSVMLPIIAQNANSAAQTMLTSQGIQKSTNGTGASTFNTAAIAQTIAGYVAIMAKQNAKDAFYNYALEIDPEKASPEEKKLHQMALSSSDAQQFYKKSKELSEGTAWWNMFQKDTNAMEKYLSIYGATAYQTVYGMSADDAVKKSSKFVEDAVAKGTSMSNILTTLEKNYQSTQFTDALIGAYLSSDIGEVKDSGSSSSKSSDSDSSSDKTKTRKERVDLVLCSKKEIPKLNVNLFKKAPSFTVLNKNFKLRDIKVNTEDKPKAILSSIKNAIIDVQKRSDPKIIQDESAEYDPVAATDGSSVPSGSTSTSTDV